MAVKNRNAGEPVIRVMFAHDTNAFGGLEIVVLRLMERIDRQRFELSVLVPDTNDRYRRPPPDFIDGVTQLGVPVIWHSVPSSTAAGRIAEIAAITRVLRRARPDIVHIHSARVEGARKVTLAARLARVPVMLRTEHSSPTAFSRTPTNTRARAFYDRMTARVLTVSEHDRIEQIEIAGRDPSRVMTLHNGVDHRLFDPSAAGAEPAAVEGVSPDRVTVGTVGRFAKEKGHEYLVRAHAELIRAGEAVQLLLVGSGPLELSLRELAENLGVDDTVVFAGQQADPRPFLGAMHVAVMPSLHEGFSLSLLEMMALCRPTVVTDLPGLREAVVEDVTSLVVPCRDPVALAAAISGLVADPCRRAAMGQSARQRVIAHFTLDGYVAATEQLYEDLLAVRRRSS